MRILIVDDDASLTTMLTEYLGSEGFEVEATQHGSAGTAAAETGRYALVILDIMLPGISGIEVLRRIRQSSQVPVIMLTAKGDDVDRVVGLELGADDYISKPFLARELLARLKAVLRRTAAAESRAPKQSVSFGKLVLSPPSRRVTWGNTVLELTTTEFNLLEMLMRAPGELITKDTLSENALGRRRTSYDRSVDVHVGNLRRKLAAASSGEVEIHTVRGMGYSLGPPS